MPSEFRFEDLDLREEARSTERAVSAVDNTGAPPLDEKTDVITTNHACTRVCCV